jgi:hypothetical protein
LSVEITGEKQKVYLNVRMVLTAIEINKFSAGRRVTELQTEEAHVIKAWTNYNENR